MTTTKRPAWHTLARATARGIVRNWPGRVETNGLLPMNPLSAAFVKPGDDALGEAFGLAMADEIMRLASARLRSEGRVGNRERTRAADALRIWLNAETTERTSETVKELMRRPDFPENARALDPRTVQRIIREMWGPRSERDGVRDLAPHVTPRGR